MMKKNLVRSKLMMSAAITLIALTSGLTVFAEWGDFPHVRIVSSINWNGPGKCLDVANGVAAVGTPVVQYDCNGGPNQRFSIKSTWGLSNYTIDGEWIRTELAPNLCVGESEPWAGSNEQLRLVPCMVDRTFTRTALWDLYPYNGADINYEWQYINGTVQFRSVHARQPGDYYNNYCLDVPSGSNLNSLWLQLYYCNYDPSTNGNQLWYVLRY